MEDTRLVPGYEAYAATAAGAVISLKTNKELKQQDNIVKGKVSGYKYVTLLWVPMVEVGYGYMMPKRIPLHRLICMAFHGMPPEGKPWVNHIDGNKANNHYTNLEWSSISDNIKHSIATGLRPIKRGSEHWLTGRTVSKQTKAKMSEAKKGEKHPKFKGWYVVNGRKFAVSGEAAKHYNQLTGKSLSNKTVISYCMKKKDFCYFIDKQKIDK